MKRFLFLFLIIPFFVSAQDKSPKPAWVEKVSIEGKGSTDQEGSFYYHLIDKQDHIPLMQSYRHYAVEVLNTDGIGIASDLDFTFDPSYQKLKIHELTVHRDGKSMNKFKDSRISTIQREESLERSIYDGSLTTVVNLTDIRVGDIVEYSYTIEGFNPINKGFFATEHYFQFTIPVNRVYTRLLTDSKRDIDYLLNNGAEEPEINTTRNGKEYVWDVDANEQILYEDYTPSWYFAQKSATVSNYDSWAQVVNWALPLYDYSNDRRVTPDTNVGGDLTQENRILNLIRWVQDDIRYLGLEGGIGAYKPNLPSKVADQRFGDCKDKTLLLISLLRNEGVEAYPVLVNTSLKHEVANSLPSHQIFNHAIVYFNFGGEDYFIDPTINSQGGDLEHMADPPYRKGLIVRKGETGLTEIRERNIPHTKIIELYTLDSVGGGAEVLIRTEYTGAKSDEIRSYINSTTKENLAQDYLDYYSIMYPDIQSSKEMKIMDFDKRSTNVLTIEEYYTIPNFWQAEEEGMIYCEFYPLVLDGNINYGKTADRSMPYYTGPRFTYEQNTSITLPEEWSFERTNDVSEKDAYDYIYKVSGLQKNINLTYSYARKKESIHPDSVNVFLKEHELIRDNLSYALTYNTALFNSSFSLTSLLIAMITLAIGAFLFIRLYKRYDPEAKGMEEHSSIGGWLILPAIGITFSPLVLLYTIIENDYFNDASWAIIAGLENSGAVLLVFVAEIIYNFGFFLYSILIIVLFYQRRTSLPLLISIFYALSLFVPMLFMGLSEVLIPNAYTGEDYSMQVRDTTRSIIAAAIWIPYFNVSQRVKGTFTVRFKKDTLTEETF